MENENEQVKVEVWKPPQPGDKIILPLSQTHYRVGEHGEYILMSPKLSGRQRRYLRWKAKMMLAEASK